MSQWKVSVSEVNFNRPSPYASSFRYFWDCGKRYEGEDTK